MRLNSFITATVVMLLAATMLDNALYAGGNGQRRKQNSGIVTPEIDAQFEERVNQLIRSGFVFKRPEPALLEELLNTNTVVDTLGLTIYDYSYNQINGRMVARIFGGAFDGVHLVYMKRTDTNSIRFAAYRYYSYALPGFLGEFIPTNEGWSGWARVADGANHSGIYIYHTLSVSGTHLRIDDGEGALTFTYNNVVDPQSQWPGVAVNGNTIIVTTSDRATLIPSRTYVSTDGGLSFAEIGFPQAPTPGYIWGNAETGPLLNPVNSQQIGMANVEKDNLTVPSGSLVYSASADLSTGTAWTSQAIYEFGSILTNSTGNFYYDPGAGTVFNHFNYEYGDDGTFHIVFDGAGQQLVQASGDSFPIHPVVYWNNVHQQLIELTSNVTARNPALGDSIESLFPGRGKGNSYAHIAVGPNGILAVVWQQPELIDSTSLNITTGTMGGSLKRYYATDIYGAVSADNGLTWSVPFKIGGLEGEMDLYPNLARDIELDNQGNYIIHFIYFWDTNPGSSIHSETDASLCAWVYSRFNISPFLFSSSPRIISVNPDSAYIGESLALSIFGENTVFRQDTLSSNNVWLARNSEIIQANSVNVITPTALITDFNIPAGVSLGLWDVNVEQVGGAGIVTFSNGFTIYDRMVDSLSLVVSTIDAFPGDTVVIPLQVEIPPDSLYSSVEVYLKGFQRQIGFLDVITAGSLIGNAGWTVQFNNTDSVLTIAAAGANDITGSGALLSLKVAIPDTTPVGFVPINLDSAVFNNGATYVRLFSGGVEVILPRPGDVDHNDIIQAFDASLILKYLVGLIQLSPTQRSNANVSSDTTISGLDADLVLQFVVGLIDTLPYDTSITAQGIVVMHDGVFQPGEMVEAPLYLEGSANIRGFEAELAFDTTELEFSEIIWGDSLANVMKVNNNDQAGRIRIGGAGKIPDSESGVFIVLKFSVDPAFNGETIKIVLTKLRFNEGKTQRDVAQAILYRLTGLRGDDGMIPATFRLEQNFPNPFNLSTNIRYGLPHDVHVSLNIYDINGKKVVTLLNAPRPAGWHIAEWRGVNDNGQKVSSGIYLVRIKAGSFTFVKKMILLK